jgi:hypothetical protein
MKEELNIDTLLNEVVKQKKDTVEKLLSILKMTDDVWAGNKIALALVDHFKDDRIESCLVNLIKDSRWKNRNGTLLFALGEYTNDPKYLYFLADLLLKSEKTNDGEIFMSAGGMIINLHPPLDSKEITRTLRRVRREEKKTHLSDRQRRLVHSLLNYLEGQRKITKFYNRFAPPEPGLL